MNYRLSPSDLTFLYSGCKRCFYNKVVNAIQPPSIPLPSVFSQIASLLKDHYTNKRASELHLSLPPGVVSLGEKRVKSQPIEFPTMNASCYIAGRFDIVVSFDDGTYGVIDFKTSNPSRDSAEMYSRQLHAYAYALEHPASNALSLCPVTKLGLLYFNPSIVKQDSVERLLYESEITWVEIEKNEGKFLDFIVEVMLLLESSEAPECSPSCKWCNYLNRLSGI